MSENTFTKQTTDISNIETPVAEAYAPLTEREIFEKIAGLQKQLTESSYHSLHRLDDSISSICDGENEDKHDQILELCSVFKMRETTLLKMLELYERMYNDLHSSEKNRIDTIKTAFSDQLELISKSELDSGDKYALISEITNKIGELVENLLVPATPEINKQKIANDMTRILNSGGASNEAKAYAAGVLEEYMSGD